MAFTAITPGLDWQAAAFVNEFIKGFNERMPRDYATGLGFADCSTIAEVVAGNDIQLASFWAGLQDRIEDQYDNPARYNPGGGNVSIRWLVPYDLAEDGTNYFNAFPSPVNWAGFCADNTDIATDGWRRATTWPTDWTDLNDAAYVAAGYGQMQAGDIIGPWIFADLQTALDNMRTRYYTSANFTEAQILEPKGDERVFTGDGPADDYTTVVVPDWLAESSSAVRDHPLAYHSKSGFINRHTVRRIRARYAVYANTTAGDFTVADPEGMANGATGAEAVRYYLKTVAPSGVNSNRYNANGDGGIENVFAKMTTGTLGDLSGYVGTIDAAPAECTDGFVLAATVSKGYAPSGSIGVSFNIVDFSFTWIK